jgi:hypothetical protein
MDLFDTSAVSAALKQLLSRMRQSAPVYQSRLLAAKERQAALAALRAEKASLLELIPEEKSFKSTRTDQVSQADLEVRDSEAEFGEARRRLDAAVLCEAGLSGREAALVFRFGAIEGTTPRTERSRLQARRIELRARLTQRVDQLRSLRRRVFCLREDEPSDCGLGGAPRLPEEESIAKVCQERLGGLGSHFVPQPTAWARLCELVSKRLHGPPRVDPVGFYVLRFARPPSLPLVPPRGGADEPSPVLTLKGDASSLLEEFCTDREVAAQRPDSRVSASSEVLLRATRQLRDGQSTINQLSRVMSCDPGVPLDIWETERQIHSRMEMLMQKIDRSIARAVSCEVGGAIAAFGYERADPVAIDEPFHTQIDRCSAFITRLQTELFAVEPARSPYIEQITNTVSAMRQPAETSYFPEADSSPEDVAQPRVSELLSAVVARQRRDLNALSVAIRSLPEQVQHHFGDFSGTLPAIPSVRLPPRLDSAFTAPTPPVSDAVAESNAHLLGRVQANLILCPQLVLQEPAALKQTSDHRLTEIISRWKNLVTEASNATEMNALLRGRAAVEGELRDAETPLAQRKEKRQAGRNRMVGLLANKLDRIRETKEAMQKRHPGLQAGLQELVPMVDATTKAIEREQVLAREETEEFGRVTAELEEKF